MIDVALRRGNISTWAWLSPMYLALGIVAFLLHAQVLRQLFPQAGPALLQRVLLSGIAFVVATAVAGTLASFPLRAILE